jgi:hypothetical protein
LTIQKNILQKPLGGVDDVAVRLGYKGKSGKSACHLDKQIGF